MIDFQSFEEAGEIIDRALLITATGAGEKLEQLHWLNRHGYLDRYDLEVAFLVGVEYQKILQSKQS